LKDWNVSRKKVGMMNDGNPGHQHDDWRKAFESTMPDLAFITEGHKLASGYSKKKAAMKDCFRRLCERR